MAQTAGRIAAIAGADSETTQALLAATVTGWRAFGAKVAGVTGERHGPRGRTCTAGALREIVSGKLYPIHLEIPPIHTSCDIAGKPLLTTVSDRHRDAWQAFAPDAIWLPAGEAAIQDWWHAVRTR